MEVERTVVRIGPAWMQVHAREASRLPTRLQPREIAWRGKGILPPTTCACGDGGAGRADETRRRADSATPSSGRVACGRAAAWTPTGSRGRGCNGLSTLQGQGGGFTAGPMPARGPLERAHLTSRLPAPAFSSRPSPRFLCTNKSRYNLALSLALRGRGRPGESSSPITITASPIRHQSRRLPSFSPTGICTPLPPRRNHLCFQVESAKRGERLVDGPLQDSSIPLNSNSWRLAGPGELVPCSAHGRADSQRANFRLRRSL